MVYLQIMTLRLLIVLCLLFSPLANALAYSGLSGAGQGVSVQHDCQSPKQVHLQHCGIDQCNGELCFYQIPAALSFGLSICTLPAGHKSVQTSRVREVTRFIPPDLRPPIL